MYLVGNFKLEGCDVSLNGNYDIIIYSNEIKIKLFYRTNNNININVYLTKIINIIKNNKNDDEIILFNYNENNYSYYRYKNRIFEIYNNFILPNGYISITKYNTIQYSKCSDYISPYEVIIHPINGSNLTCLIMVYSIDTKDIDLIGIY
ncbi:ORF MSV126 hypothetical protein [Melanoplus sanguinipes entomopoxvirus]|uniref:Uncharacterized protein n=1 Tax=Melanoplus sanguinipes entomopoxvirus TaxID=83191 RepID=Q9YVW6_MSEPV|nr:ORF MSV126 hypothetical protein [Melanoplus sanguinipes entomopoxvirus]AAC97797.1 ORF MSV126 hypothetical protein [Melanoplus sanguinipes entomopoxvirus 'O']